MPFALMYCGPTLLDLVEGVNSPILPCFSQCNEGDDAHGVLADRTAQRVHMPHAQNHTARGGMGMRGGAVCHIRANACKLNRLGREDFLLGGSILIAGSR